MSFDGTAQLPVGSSKARHSLYESFELVPALNADLNSVGDATSAAELTKTLVANKSFELLGTNASTGDATLDVDGGIKCETDGASGDENIILPHLDSGQSAWHSTKWDTEKQVGWGCVIQTGSSVADTTIWAGLKLTNTDVIGTDEDQAFFRYNPSENGGKWQLITRDNNAANVIRTVGPAVAASTTYYLSLKINSAFDVSYTVNDVTGIASTAVRTGINLIPYIGISAEAAAAKHFYVRKTWISKAY